MEAAQLFCGSFGLDSCLKTWLDTNFFQIVPTLPGGFYQQGVSY